MVILTQWNIWQEQLIVHLGGKISIITKPSITSQKLYAAGRASNTELSMLVSEL